MFLYKYLRYFSEQKTKRFVIVIWTNLTRVESIAQIYNNFQDIGGIRLLRDKREHLPPKSEAFSFFFKKKNEVN